MLHIIAHSCNQFTNHIQGSLMPPSNLQISPVAQEFLIIPQTAKANSVEFPNRPNGVLAIMSYTIFLFTPLPIGVSKMPGAIVITLILYLPRSLAIGRVMPIIAPFDAEQTTWPFCPSMPATLETFIKTPLSPLTSSCSDITLAAYLQTLSVPMTLILSTFSIFQDETTPLLKIVVPAAMMPAQFTTTSIRLQFSTVNFISYCTFFSSATLVLKNKHFSFPAIYFPCSSFKSAITTFAP